MDDKNYVKYQVIGTNNVAVPTHFFKVLVGELGMISHKNSLMTIFVTSMNQKFHQKI